MTQLTLGEWYKLPSVRSEKEQGFLLYSVKKKDSNDYL